MQANEIIVELMAITRQRYANHPLLLFGAQLGVNRES
jgi:hypothetical protein